MTARLNFPYPKFDHFKAFFHGLCHSRWVGRKPNVFRNSARAKIHCKGPQPILATAKFKYCDPFALHLCLASECVFLRYGCTYGILRRPTPILEHFLVTSAPSFQVQFVQAPISKHDGHSGHLQEQHLKSNTAPGCGRSNSGRTFGKHRAWDSEVLALLSLYS